MRVKVQDPERFVKRAFFLLWNACGGTVGMGYLQDNPRATEDDVFQNVSNCGDYAMNINSLRGQSYYGDYVFGRMMKWGCDIKDGVIEIPDKDFSVEYQGFARTYPNNTAIVEATAKSLDVEFADEVALEAHK